MRVTIICPQAHIEDANHLAMVLGYSAADAATYGDPSWQDKAGNLYAVASLLVSDDFVSAATTALARPDWDDSSIVAMAAARRAQALVSVWGLGEDEPAPVASPSRILAMFGDDPHGLLAMAGVVRGAGDA